MDSEQRVKAIDEAATEAERGGDEMEQHLDELSDHIEEAKETAALRQDAPKQDDAGDDEPAQPDWRQESVEASYGAPGDTSGEGDADDEG